MADQAVLGGETPRLKQLRALREQIPVAASRAAAQQQAGQQVQLQRAISQAPAAAPQAAQQLGAAAATGQAQAAVKPVEQAGQAIQQVAQLQQAEQGRQATEEVGALGRGTEQALAQQQAQLKELAGNTADQIASERNQFSRDEAGRTALNERQLADWSMQNARDSRDFAAKQQQSQQLHTRKLRMLEITQKKLEEALKSEQALREQGLGNAQIQELYTLERDMRAQIKKQQQEIAVKNSMWTAGGAIVGGVVGAVVTSESGGWGAAPGAAIGGGAGSYIASEQGP